MTPSVAAPPAAPKPPVAKKVPHETVLHGDRLSDPYFWLREKDDPEVRAYLEAENAYTDSVMAPTKALQDRLYGEILGRIQQTDLTVPYPLGGYLYYSRTEEGKQYPIMCRKKGELTSPEEVMLDLNELAKGESFLSVGYSSVSDDGGMLVYGIDTTGFRQYALRVKDLRTGQTLAERIPKTTSAAWAADGGTLFYVVEDPAKRPYRLYRHTLGSDGPDPLLYEEKDERFSLGVSRCRSRQYLFLKSDSLTASEVRVLPAAGTGRSWSRTARP
jgi:oligopeptidase B